MQHVSDVVVQLLLVFSCPILKGGAVRKHSIARITQVRVDCSQGSHGTLGLCALQTRNPLGVLVLLDGRQDPVDVLQTLRLARSALQVVRWPTVHKPTKIRHEE